VGGKWLNPVLWAQNVFPACLEDANGAHEPIRIVFFQRFGKKIVCKNICSVSAQKKKEKEDRVS